MSRTEHQQMPLIRPGQLSVRKQRIERWAHKDRNVSSHDKAVRSSAVLGSSLGEKKSESSFIQADRRLNMHLYQLGQQREKLLERHNFDQKLFAAKQALRHKDNEDLQRTVNYVRKCCKYTEIDHDNKEESVNSTLLFKEGHSKKNIRSRSVAPIKLTIKQPRHNETPKDSIPFRMSTKGGSQSAHVSGRSYSLAAEHCTESASVIRSVNSAPARTSIYYRKEVKKSNRPSSRIFASKHTLQQFRRHPEQFLSHSNRYLPLLRRQAIDNELKSKKQPTQSIGRFSDGSDAVFDDAKSFLSEENETIEKIPHLPAWDSHDRRNTNKTRVSNKINVVEPAIDNSSERTLALTRLRDREYAHLQELIRTNSIRHILEPLSTFKSSEKQGQNLDKILHSNESLRYSKTSTKQAMNIEKNLSKFSILIF